VVWLDPLLAMSHIHYRKSVYVKRNDIINNQCLLTVFSAICHTNPIITREFFKVIMLINRFD